MKVIYNTLWRSQFWLLWLGVTAILLVPAEYIGSPVFDWWDKAQHGLVFFVLTISAYLAYSSKLRWILIGLFLFGGVIELLQSVTGWRQGDLFDWLADAIGVAVAYFGLCFFSGRQTLHW